MHASVLFTAATVFVGTLVCSIIGDSCTRLQNSALKNGIKLEDHAVGQYVGAVSLPRCYLLCHLDASCHCGSYNSQTQMCGKSSTRRIESRNSVANNSWISFNTSEETRNGLQCEVDGDCQGVDARAVCIYKYNSDPSGLCMCNSSYAYNVDTGYCDIETRNGLQCEVDGDCQGVDARAVCIYKYNSDPSGLCMCNSSYAYNVDTGYCDIGCFLNSRRVYDFENYYIRGYHLGTNMTEITWNECIIHCRSYNHNGYSFDYVISNGTCSCNSITRQQCVDSDPGSLVHVSPDENGDPMVTLRTQFCV